MPFSTPLFFGGRCADAAAFHPKAIGKVGDGS